jgi:hypothetical protein
VNNLQNQNDFAGRINPKAFAGTPIEALCGDRLFADI